MAESVARLADRTTGSALVSSANGITGGFAGFTAPAYLTLAEAASIVGADGGDMDWVRWSLNYAARAAHNIRDPVHCARVTARVAAMRARWWPGPAPAQLPEVVARLQTDPSASEFAALHVVGESFTFREIDDLPAGTRTARTLRELAGVYARPLGAFVRLNAGCDPDEPLASGLSVNVPDPGFPPLLAARLSAAPLTHNPATTPAGGTGSTEPAEALIRRLVPVAGGDATALSTTLSRLLLATPTDDPSLPGELDRLIPNLRTRSTADLHQLLET
jgi:hypothetical protein